MFEKYIQDYYVNIDRSRSYYHWSKIIRRLCKIQLIYNKLVASLSNPGYSSYFAGYIRPDYWCRRLISLSHTNTIDSNKKCIENSENYVIFLCYFGIISLSTRKSVLLFKEEYTDGCIDARIERCSPSNADLASREASTKIECIHKSCDLNSNNRLSILFLARLCPARVYLAEN